MRQRPFYKLNFGYLFYESMRLVREIWVMSQFHLLKIANFSGVEKTTRKSYENA